MKKIFYAIILITITTLLTGCNSQKEADRLPASGTAAKYCPDLLKSLIKKANQGEPTQIEKLFSKRAKPLSPSENLTQSIEELKEVDYELWQKVVKARRNKERGNSLLLDLGELPGFMINFLEGPFKKVVGNRGLSEPFVKITSTNDNTLVIRHYEDKYPLMVRWSDENTVPAVSKVAQEKIDGETYRVLTLSAALRAKDNLNQIDTGHIYKFVSASRLQKFISSRNSLVMRVASLLHEGKVIFDRMTQRDFNDIRSMLDVDGDLRRSVRSLLFVAPTAAGKTRILGNAITSKLKSALATPNVPKKKLTVLMTKTPDLTNTLAKEIGEQLFQDVGSENYRLIQWGGNLSENWSHRELMEFIEKSDVPVVLVTSYPTMGNRVKTSEQMEELLSLANGIHIDEAHNVGGKVFKRVFDTALNVASRDREKEDLTMALDILGVTASPITRTQRTIELFDASYWASIDRPKEFAKNIARGDKEGFSPVKSVLEWIRVMRQFDNARNRGEINAPDDITYFNTRAEGYDFDSIFKRASRGTHSLVDMKKLKAIWPQIEKKLDMERPGIFHTHPRDAGPISELISELTGKNIVNLQNLSPKKRDAVYEAFKNQTPFEGRKVDAIVGTIREGLDFPKASYYLSFKKYVRFPETLQGRGRVVRLDLDKLPPTIIYFGEETDRIAYAHVKELIMRRLGRRPRRFQSTRSYTGARRPDLTKNLGQASEKLNEALEAFIRINYETMRQVIDVKKPDPTLMKEIQQKLTKMRKSKQNREISKAINEFVYAVNSYPFYQGNLDKTWDYCNKMIKASKSKGTPRNLSEADKKLLKDKAMMAKVQEFKDMYAWLGVVPRAIIQDMPLQPNNVREVAKSIDVFIEENGVLPYQTGKRMNSLASLMKEVVNSSPEALWRNLRFASRTYVDELINNTGEQSFESAFETYFKSRNKLPETAYHLIGDSDRAIADDIGHRLAIRFSTYLKSGRLRVSNLSPGALEAIDKSKAYKLHVEELITAMIDLKKELRSHLDAGEEIDVFSDIFNLENIMKYDEFGLIRVIKKMSDQGQKNSTKYLEVIESELERLRSS